MVLSLLLSAEHERRPKIKDSRRYRRYLVKRKAILRAQDTQVALHVIARDISMRGVCLLVNGCFPSPGRHKVALTLRGDARQPDSSGYIEFLVQSIYCVELPQQRRYGFEIVEMDERYRQVLSDYLAEKERSEQRRLSGSAAGYSF